MNNKYKNKSQEVRKELKISDCKLMHLREEGILRSVKKGNAFFYHEDDVNQYKEQSSR
jgi:hypothetical protein